MLCNKHSQPNKQQPTPTPQQETQPTQLAQMTQLESSQQESRKIQDLQDARIQMLEDRIKLLEQQFTLKKDNTKDDQQEWRDLARAMDDRRSGAEIVNHPKKQVMIRAPEIDIDGNEDQNQVEGTEPRSYDWTQVKLPKRKRAQRPDMSPDNGQPC